MKLVMTLLVRDEEDVLPANIAFHLRQGVDFIIATDNRSCDKTPDLLRHFERQGVLKYIYEPADDYSQYRWVTRMARSAFLDYGADWIINSDADEFWWPAAGDSLRETLAGVPADVKAVSAERVNFVPREETGGVAFYETMVFREAKSLDAEGRPLPPKVCHRGSRDLEVAQGNHSVAIGGQEINVMPSQIQIFHFPLRSYRQFENKVVKGGQAYQNNTELPKEIGWTWRRLFALYQEGKLPSYYSQQIYGDDAIENGIADGTLVEDRRLLEFLRSIRASALWRQRLGPGRHLRAARRWFQRIFSESGS
ncbi:MAG: glycosyltransferase family 2 protein [Chromatiaceae bacterium]|nr:glycosyltransferase family 2 protein [Chromatiaceae bacterium]